MTHVAPQSTAARLPVAGERWRLLAGLALLVLGLLAGGWQAPAVAQDGAATVYVVPVQGTIEPGLGHFLKRALDEAEAAGATAVVLEINTPGGRLDTVLQMRDALLDSSLPVIAYVNREAFSAGALVTIAADQIWMAPAAVFGAATPVLGDGATASEKTISAVRSTFRATAEQNGRDPAIAEAMVDPAVVVDGLDGPETLLTLTVEQARTYGYADGVAVDRQDLLQALGYAGATVVELSPSGVERLVRWITDPLAASLLITLGLFLIIADAVFAGFGVAAVAGVLCLGLFFWGHLLAGLTGWEDLALVALGLVLIGLEIFVIPGFGAAGVAGIVALAAGLVLSMIGRGVGGFRLTDELVQAGWVVTAALGVVAALLVGLGLLMPRLAGNPAQGRRGFGWLALTATVDDAGRPPRAARPAGWLVRLLGGHEVLERDDRPPREGPRR